MSNEVVKYHNKMNEIAFRKFTSIELDMFFSICYKMKKKHTNIVKLSFEELKTLIKYKYTGLDRFVSDLESMYDKIINVSFKIGDSKNFIKFIVFTTYKINSDEHYIEISLNKEFENILNDLTSNFTRFELEEFTKLRSSYSKQMFKLLAQYNSTGIYIISLDEFKRLLDIPVSYKPHHIDQRVLKPILEELPFYFKNLKIEKIKKKRSIERLKFTFTKRKEKTINSNNGKLVVADMREFEDIQKEQYQKRKEEFESLNPSEQAKLIKEQLYKKNV